MQAGLGLGVPEGQPFSTIPQWHVPISAVARITTVLYSLCLVLCADPDQGTRPRKRQKHGLGEQGLCAGGAGSGGARGARGKLSALLRGRRSSADAIKVQGVTGEHLRAAAQLTAGFSGRELAKLMASVQVRLPG